MKRDVKQRVVARSADAAAPVRVGAETSASGGAMMAPAMALAVVVAREGDGWRVRAGGAEALATVDPSVDVALVAAAQVSGARVVLELGEAAVIVGALQTARAVTVDRDGDVTIAARAFTVTAEERAVLRSPGAFVMVAPGEVEVFANRVLTRAREVAKTLAAMIKFN